MGRSLTSSLKTYEVDSTMPTDRGQSSTNSSTVKVSHFIYPLVLVFDGRISTYAMAGLANGSDKLTSAWQIKLIKVMVAFPHKKNMSTSMVLPRLGVPRHSLRAHSGVLERRQWHWHPRRPIKELHTSQEKILPHCKWVWLVGNKSIAMPPLRSEERRVGKEC